MTPEHPGPPEQQDFHHKPGPEAERVVTSTLAGLASVEDELRVVEGFLTHGAGFAAFLRLPDAAPADPTLIHRYERCYADAWENLNDLVTDTIEALGWRDELAAFREREVIPEDYLTWNYHALHSHLKEIYTFVHLDGWIHAFHR